MRAFACPRCGQLVYFENDTCLRCQADLGFDPDLGTIVLVASDEGVSVGRHCANQALAGCNWLVSSAETGGLCRSCRTTRTRPADADLKIDPDVVERFVRTEAAKRRLVFQLFELDLPITTFHENPDTGLAFDLLVKKAEPITIGHADGVITIDLAESDDAYRERMRAQLDETYRTMLGHLRHEVGHYYWQVLVEPDPRSLDGFRECFGDDRRDYQQALEAHYDQGPSPEWSNTHVSAYAAAHPWEDWAETWAHYLHIRDTLQTAAGHGVIVTGPRSETASFDPTLEASLIAAPSVDAEDNFEDILAEWLPLTYALNAINRSMGKDDLYPFVLNATVVAKLRFVHRQVERASGRMDVATAPASPSEPKGVE